MTEKVPQTRDDLAEALRNAGQFAHPAMDHWYCLADAVLRWREAWIAEALRCAVMEQEEPRKIPPPGEVFVRKNT